MSSSQLQTRKSGVYVVADDTPLADCLAHMAENNQGSAIVTKGGQVVGILTERDLLKLWRSLADPEFLKSPVGSLSTNPVFTMSPDDIGNAPLEMVRRGIRNIPLVDKTGKILGIITMRDILVAQLKARTLPKLAKKAAQPEAAGNATLHVFTPTAGLMELCEKIVPLGWKVTAWDSPVALKGTVAAGGMDPTHNVIMVDLDGSAGDKWRDVVREFIGFLNNPSHPAVFLVFSPSRLSDKEVASLRTVAEKGNWHLYQRPLAAGALAEDIAALTTA